MNKLVRAAALLAVCVGASVAQADWHTGKIGNISIGYDGSTITFNIQGYTRTNCTCYSTWNTNMCLNRARVSFKEEVAMLYSVKARDRDIAVNIDENSCTVVAMYEP